MIGSVIAFPSVYSAVEPHIQITMESSQTQNPFVIKDNFGVEVFTIDPSGVITPSQGGGGGVTGEFGTEIVVIDNFSANTSNDNLPHAPVLKYQQVASPAANCLPIPR